MKKSMENCLSHTLATKRVIPNSVPSLGQYSCGEGKDVVKYFLRCVTFVSTVEYLFNGAKICCIPLRCIWLTL